MSREEEWERLASVLQKITYAEFHEDFVHVFKKIWGE